MHSTQLNHFKVKMKNLDFESFLRIAEFTHGSAETKFISLQNPFSFLQILSYFFHNYQFIDEKFADIGVI